jgi:hypothetical protein
VPISISTKTGTHPFMIIGFMVVGKPAATVITSSPGRTLRSLSSFAVNAVNARRFAELHEFVVITCLIPMNCESLSSNSLFHLPSVQ